MVRHCSGLDNTLTMLVDPLTGRRLESPTIGEVPRACNCGLRFDDEKRSTIWPHLIITRGVA
jgi:hypothetical protein